MRPVSPRHRRGPCGAFGADDLRRFGLDQLQQDNPDRLPNQTRAVPARTASSNSDTADQDNAIGGLLFSVCWPFTPKIPPMTPSLIGPRRRSPQPHHATGLKPPPDSSVGHRQARYRARTSRLPHEGPASSGRRRRRSRTSIVAIAARVIPPRRKRSPTLGPARQSLTGSSSVSAQAMSAPFSRP